MRPQSSTQTHPNSGSIWQSQKKETNKQRSPLAQKPSHYHTGQSKAEVNSHQKEKKTSLHHHSQKTDLGVMSSKKNNQTNPTPRHKKTQFQVRPSSRNQSKAGNAPKEQKTKLKTTGCTDILPLSHGTANQGNLSHKDIQYYRHSQKPNFAAQSPSREREREKKTSHTCPNSNGCPSPSSQSEGRQHATALETSRPLSGAQGGITRQAGQGMMGGFSWSQRQSLRHPCHWTLQARPGRTSRECVGCWRGTAPWWCSGWSRRPWHHRWTLPARRCSSPWRAGCGT